MATKALETLGRRALLISPVVFAVVGFFAALRWLRPQSSASVLVLSAVVGIFVMGYSAFLARRLQRRLDEVQIAHQEYAHTRGWVWGLAATTLVLMLPPVTNLLIDFANVLSTGSPDTASRTSVQVALFFGLMLVGVIQTVCIIIAATIWQRRMGVPDQT